MAQKFQLLYIDDEPDYLEKAREQILNSQEWEITVANSIERAKSLIDGGGFDVAIIDLGMGGGRGWDPKSGSELAQRVKIRHAASTIVLLSGMGRMEGAKKVAKELVARIVDKLDIADLGGIEGVARSALFENFNPGGKERRW